MQSLIARWVKQALAHANMKQTELARRLSERLHKSIDRSMVNKMTRGTRNVDAYEMLAIESITGYAAPDSQIASGPAPLTREGESLDSMIADCSPETKKIARDLVAVVVERDKQARRRTPRAAKTGSLRLRKQQKSVSGAKARLVPRAVI